MWKLSQSKVLVWILILFWLYAFCVTLSDKKRLLLDDSPRVTLCNVGQGDAILITQERTQILIDGGPDASIVHCLSKMIPKSDKEIELVVLTHADSDHLSGLIDVFKNYRVKKLLINDVFKKTNLFLDFYELVWKKIETEGLEVVYPVLAQKWCEAETICLEILWHDQKNKPGEIFSYKYELSILWDILKKSDHIDSENNNGSIVINMNIVHKNIILTGDINQDVELAIINSGLLKKSNWLKIAHHGSKTSTSAHFLSIVRPEISLISVGEKNRFGHPSIEVLERLKEINSQILRTDQDGQITLVLEDNQFLIETKKNNLADH